MKINNIQETIEGAVPSTPLSQYKDLLIIKSANEWIQEAKKKPTPKMLCGELWFEGELCILFASNNIGKTILGVQIADSISRGVQMGNFKLQTPKQKVLYLDCELTDKQFQRRYSNEDETDEYSFDNNFKRVEINSNADVPTYTDFETGVYHAVERAIIETQAKVLIIDNLTFLKSGTETAKDAIPLMKTLKMLKTKHALSIMALAHTPKRDATSPLTINDMQGSAMIGNFIDSCFAIGKSVSDDLRYIKQLKQRSCEHVYHADNVVIAEISKPSNFLQLEFVGNGEESKLLKLPSEKDKDELITNVKKLRSEGFTVREIAEQLNISKSTADRLSKK
ncbi:AAA family ATPase [Dysgonomonas sp. HGC4]|uniref:AAA family ATPase n=1 Tax=Dysgonomonas sp. HGC4 TaxID=1658009 RepID=UPI000681D9A7|nr:AAA family ATPase [Dysgonomonas sp. HGC4]MBD8348976.1 AAA family ATPase [Dysgonomonas sp. HGC4]